MTAQEILDEIKPLGSETYKRVIFKHGVTEPCKTPYTPEYIEKIRLRGSIGKKRKTAKC